MQAFTFSKITWFLKNGYGTSLVFSFWLFPLDSQKWFLFNNLGTLLNGIWKLSNLRVGRCALLPMKLQVLLWMQWVIWVFNNHARRAMSTRFVSLIEYYINMISIYKLRKYQVLVGATSCDNNIAKQGLAITLNNQSTADGGRHMGSTTPLPCLPKAADKAGWHLPCCGWDCSSNTD